MAGTVDKSFVPAIYLLNNDVIFVSMAISDSDINLVLTKIIQDDLSHGLPNRKGASVNGVRKYVKDVVDELTVLINTHTSTGGGAVDSVNGHTGVVVLDKTDIGLSNVDNVQQMPLSYLDTDGTLAADSDVKVASQKATRTYILQKITDLVASSPATLDTLNELATALGNDPNFATTIATALSGKQPLSSELTTIAAIAPSNDDFIQRKGGVWVKRTVQNVMADMVVSGFVSAAGTSANTDTVEQILEKVDGNIISFMSQYCTLNQVMGAMIAAVAAGKYCFVQNGGNVAISGTARNSGINSIYIRASDFQTVGGKAPKLRIRAIIYTNNVAPAVTFTLGLYPVTVTAGAGNGLTNPTIGTVITGSTAAFTTPAANSGLQVTGTDFDLPADGLYAIGLATSGGSTAASSTVAINAALQVHNA